MYHVIVCERRTGIVCHPDGTWHLLTQGPYQPPTFLTFEAAAAFCAALRSSHPSLECHLRDACGAELAVFPPPRSGEDTGQATGLLRDDK
jgi:hypothetical protein